MVELLGAFLALLVLDWFFMGVYVTLHENGHVRIYKERGVKAKFKWKWGEGFFVEALEPAYNPRLCRELNAMHSVHDSISAAVLPLFFVALAVFDAILLGWVVG